MVRLKEGNIYVVDQVNPEFQFQNGTIKSI